MAWYNKQTNFDDCNGHADWHNGPGITGGLIMTAVLAVAIFGIAGPIEYGSNYKNVVTYWECAANPDCAPNNENTARAITLRKLLFSNNEAAAKEIELRLLTEKKESNVAKRWQAERLVSEVKSGISRETAIKIICSMPDRAGYKMLGQGCNMSLVAKLQKGEKIELRPTVLLVFLSIAGAIYLLAGFVLMDRFIANFGRPSGGLIALMAFFAPIFAPLWTVVGLGHLAVWSAKSAKQGISQYQNRRTQEKSRREEERLLGKDLLGQKQKVADLTAEAQKIQDKTMREGLLNRLNIAAKLLEDEAKMRLEIHREAASRALRETNGAVALAKEVDEALFLAEAHRDAREIMRK